MRNYAEELAYWYLRFNGFFPLTDFVIHRGRRRDPSDCDLLAIRTPHVREDIGGNERDWDDQLLRLFDPTRTVGVICEVKAGRIEARELFRDKYVRYSIKRFGFIPDLQETNRTVSYLRTHNEKSIGDSYQVFKLLIANSQPGGNRRYHFIPLIDAHDFIKQRIRNYKEKRCDWVYFTSALLQELIWEVKRELREID